METKIVSIDSESPSLDELNYAIELLRNGAIIAFPTDTLYGLGCNVFNDQAVEKLFSLKKRPKSKPINLLVSKIDQLEEIVVEFPIIAQKLAENFWPGALTIILKKKPKIMDKVTSGFPSIGFRMPANKIALSLISEFDSPLATSSANISGHDNPTTANQVFNHFQEKIPLIFDGGTTALQKGSTVIDLTQDVPKVIREGAILLSDLRKVIPEIDIKL